MSEDAKPGPGHNSGEKPEDIFSQEQAEIVTTKRRVQAGVAGERLKTFVERVERLEEEKRALAADIKEVYSEAKSSGFNVKIIRKVIALRRMDSDDRVEQEALLDTYLRALDES